MILAIDIGWNFKTVMTVICIIVAIGSCIAMHFTNKRIENDPEYLERQKEKEEEYYRILNEQKEMEEYASELSYGSEYSDEEYYSEHPEERTIEE